MGSGVYGKPGIPERLGSAGTNLFSQIDPRDLLLVAWCVYSVYNQIGDVSNTSEDREDAYHLQTISITPEVRASEEGW